MLVWNESEFKKSWIHFDRVEMHKLIWTPQIHLLKYANNNQHVAAASVLFHFQLIVLFL